MGRALYVFWEERLPSYHRRSRGREEGLGPWVTKLLITRPSYDNDRSQFRGVAKLVQRRCRLGSVEFQS